MTTPKPLPEDPVGLIGQALAMGAEFPGPAEDVLLSWMLKLDAAIDPIAAAATILRHHGLAQGELPPGERGKLTQDLARRILTDFCVRAWFNQPQSQHTLVWIADVLDEILEKGKPDARRAFCLAPRREGGRDVLDEAVDITWWVTLAIGRGYSEPEAKKQAAAVFHRDVKHIARQRKRALGWADGMNPSVDLTVIR